MTLEETARLVGGHRWLETRLFEILGGWVGTTRDLDSKLLLDRHSQHHAWRADQWWDRLPVLADVDRDALVVPPSAATAAFTDLLAGQTGAVERLAGAYRVALPRLVGAYQHHRSGANPVSDGAVIRTLDLLLPDVTADWREGELILQQLLVAGAEVDSAAATVAGLERSLLA
jgi:hypothetical protein